MFKHIVLYKLKDSDTRQKIALKSKFMSMDGKIPEIISIEVGINELSLARNYDVSLFITFKTQQDFYNYKENDFHKTVSSYVHEVITSSVSVDYSI